MPTTSPAYQPLLEWVHYSFQYIDDNALAYLVMILQFIFVSGLVLGCIEADLFCIQDEHD